MTTAAKNVPARGWRPCFYYVRTPDTPKGECDEVLTGRARRVGRWWLAVWRRPRLAVGVWGGRSIKDAPIWSWGLPK